MVTNDNASSGIAKGSSEGNEVGRDGSESKATEASATQGNWVMSKGISCGMNGGGL